jgi:hypothetical protein
MEVNINDEKSATKSKPFAAVRRRVGPNAAGPVGSSTLDGS